MSKFTSLLDNEEKKLNDEQRAVVFADKNCVVSAGAGRQADCSHHGCI